MTEIHDLGEIDGPLLVFGGPYGNLQATEALLAKAGQLGIPPERMLCTGDLVAYCGDPKATVALIRGAGIPVVMGNCEEQLGSGAEDCGCGYADGSSCDLMAVRWYHYASEQLDADTKAWMAALPRRISLTLAGQRLVAIHGGLDRINRFVFPTTPAGEKAGQLALAAADGVIGGHSGLPFSEIIGGALWHNAGVIGLPANDGTPRVWYAVLRPGQDGLEIEHRPLVYDQVAAATTIRAADLPVAYAKALEDGLWPDDDVMPEADRQVRGTALSAKHVVWRRRGS